MPPSAVNRGSITCEKWNKLKLLSDVKRVKRKFRGFAMAPLIVGHRGASRDHPENTLDAFRGASTQLADGVELDVRSTADGVLAVCHDPRLTDGRVIAELDAASLPASMPTLADAIGVSTPMLVNVEIKHGDHEPGFSEDRRLADAVMSAIAELEAVPPILVSSFDLATIDRVRVIAAHVPTGYLVLSAIDPIDAIAVCAERGHVAIHPNDWFVDEALIGRAHDAGVAVNVWTVDDPDRIRVLASWGVDAIITNTPALARAALGL